MPQVHLETAVSQFAGTEQLIGPELDRTLAAAPDGQLPAGLAAELAAARTAALDAIGEHRRWLEQRLADGTQDQDFRDPRIGPELFARKLFHTLESGASPEELLARAMADLDETTGQIAETAARLGLRAGTWQRPADGGWRCGCGDAAPRNWSAGCWAGWPRTRRTTGRSSDWSSGPITRHGRSSESGLVTAPATGWT